MIETINLLAYRPPSGTSFSGQSEGEEVRRILNLDSLDSEKIEINFIIPAGTTSFNPTFFLGLLFNSFLKLGVEQFLEKYKFIVEDKEVAFRANLLRNLVDGLFESIYKLENINAKGSLFKKRRRINVWLEKFLEIQ